MERQIFDAALQVFAGEGRDGARLETITDAPDINKAVLHYYVRDKETPYEDIFAHTVCQFGASPRRDLALGGTVQATTSSARAVKREEYSHPCQTDGSILAKTWSESISHGRYLARS